MVGPNFCLPKSFSGVEIRLHAKFHLPMLPGNALNQVIPAVEVV